jgi:hypothetical protein
MVFLLFVGVGVLFALTSVSTDDHKRTVVVTVGSGLLIFLGIVCIVDFIITVSIQALI